MNFTTTNAGPSSEDRAHARSRCQKKTNPERENRIILRCAFLLIFAISTAVGTTARGDEQSNALAEESNPPIVRLIGARCIFCHGPVLMLAFSRKTLDTGGPPALDAFLAKHHAPDAEVREAIVRYLSQPLNEPD